MQIILARTSIASSRRGWPAIIYPSSVGSGSYPTSFSLTGKVLDQSGQGMSGVKVIVSNNEGGKFSTMTNPAGYYAIDVATGVYLVNAEFPGYVFTQTSAQAIDRPGIGSKTGCRDTGGQRTAFDLAVKMRSFTIF